MLCGGGGGGGRVFYICSHTHYAPEAESKEKHGVWDPMQELIITSPYVHSRVDSNTFTMGNHMPESTLYHSQGVWIWPLVPGCRKKSYTNVCIPPKKYEGNGLHQSHNRRKSLSRYFWHAEAVFYAELWIRIHWIRIRTRVRIQHFKWIRIQGFDFLKKKNTAEYFYIFLFKKKLQFTYPEAALQDVQAGAEAFSPQKRTSSTSKNEIFYLFLWILFALIDPDRDLQSGSGSQPKTLLTWEKIFFDGGWGRGGGRGGTVEGNIC
jgi:hypothetical protein